MPYKKYKKANKYKSMKKQYFSINCSLFRW